tara:strand:+ start:968 stop:1159 length:192 start_codon:yes stop_codon:yes gene_type:complete
MKNKELYFEIVNILNTESKKSKIFYEDDKYKIIRYKNKNKTINYESNTLKEIYNIILKDFKIL